MAQAADRRATEISNEIVDLQINIINASGVPAKDAIRALKKLKEQKNIVKKEKKWKTGEEEFKIEVVK